MIESCEARAAARGVVVHGLAHHERADSLGDWRQNFEHFPILVPCCELPFDWRVLTFHNLRPKFIELDESGARIFKADVLEGLAEAKAFAGLGMDEIANAISQSERLISFLAFISLGC